MGTLRLPWIALFSNFFGDFFLIILKIIILKSRGFNTDTENRTGLQSALPCASNSAVTSTVVTVPAIETPQCSEREKPNSFYHLLFVLNVSLYSVKLFPKQSTWFKIKDTFISSAAEETRTCLKQQVPKHAGKL